MKDERAHDVVVIGGGAAGVNAALECFDVRLDTVVLERSGELGGQLVEIPHSIRNVATDWFADGRAVQAGLLRSAAILGDRVRLGHDVTAANLAEGWVETAGTRFRAKAFLLASGSVGQALPAAVEGAFGGDVTYHVESRADRFAGRDVVIIGGGDSATLDALELVETAASVKLVHRAPALTARRDVVERVLADRRIEDLAGWELAAAHGDDHLRAVTLRRADSGDQQRVSAGGLVVKISRDPASGPFRGQVDLDRRGAVVVDALLRTSCPGVFAAGDVVSGAYWRVANALGQGVLAARSILRHIEASG
jgi:thioredoxin reductase (NADPH)